MELSLEELLSTVWQSNSELNLALTPQERRAVERYVSLHYTNPWYRKKILTWGLEHCLDRVIGAPNAYGLA